MTKRSTNFAGSRQTQTRKALQPRNIIAAMRLVGMSDDEIRAALERMRRAAAEGK